MCGLWMEVTQPQPVQHNCGHNPLHGERMGTCNVSERGRRKGGMWREVLLSTIQWSVKRRGGVSEEEGWGQSRGGVESVKRRGGVTQKEGWSQ